MSRAFFSFFYFCSRDSEKKAEKDTLAGRFAILAGGAFGECRRCGVALGHPFVYGDSPGRGGIFAFGVACFDGRPYGAPFWIFCLEAEYFREMALRCRRFCDGLVPADTPFAFASCFPYAGGRSESRVGVRIGGGVAEQRWSFFPGGPGGSPAFGVLAGAVLHFVAADVVLVRGCRAVGGVDAAPSA